MPPMSTNNGSRNIYECMVDLSKLTDRVKYNQVLKKLATHVLCYAKTWMTVDKPRTDEVD